MIGTPPESMTVTRHELIASISATSEMLTSFTGSHPRCCRIPERTFADKLSLDKVAFVIFDLSDLPYRLYVRPNGCTVRTLKSVEQTLRGRRLIALHRAPKSKRWRNRPKSSICTRPGIAIGRLIISQNKAPCSRHLFEPFSTIADAETERPGMNRAFHV
jgi:hypothetical protein